MPVQILVSADESGVEVEANSQDGLAIVGLLSLAMDKIKNQLRMKAEEASRIMQVPAGAMDLLDGQRVRK